MRYRGLEFLDNGAVKIAVISIDDISHLMRTDLYWGRMEFGKDIRQVHHIYSTDKKDEPQDIITVREKDILRLIAEGMVSKEVGKILYISSHTVDNHRRNMIAKTGMRDLICLVQICRMIGII
jgi:DNA-binding CsgD family transcriptional regulator